MDMFHKSVTTVVMTMVSLLRLKGYGGQAGFRTQKTEIRKQLKSMIIYLHLVTSDLYNLTPDTFIFEKED